MDEVILTQDDMRALLALVSNELGELVYNVPEGYDIYKLYDKLLDICELQG